MNAANALIAVIDCPACGSSLHSHVGYKFDCSMLQCSSCGTIFLGTQTCQYAVTELYNNYYDGARFLSPEAAAVSLERLVRSIEPFRQTNCWLDIGYGEGALLSIAKRHGWKCHGTELSPQALRYGEEQGWVVTKAEYDPRFQQAGFDVVTMIEFLEHAPAPDQFLQTAARWLRPGGLLYITTPNAESLNRRLLGLQWSVFSPPEHVTIWTARGLRHALTKAGFQTRCIRTDGLNPTEIIASYRRRNQGAPAVHRNTAAFALNSAFSSSRLRRAIKAGINRCLSTVRIGDTLKVWAVRS